MSKTVELVKHNEKMYKLYPECRSSQPMGITCDRMLTTLYCCRCGTIIKEVVHSPDSTEVTIDRTSGS